jgi:hypothetical protein
VVSGSWPGEIRLYPRGPDGGLLAPRLVVPEIAPGEIDPKSKDYGYNLLQAAAVAAGDLDADGDADLVVGTIFGRLYLLENATPPRAKGAGESPVFGSPTLLLDAYDRPSGFSKAGPCLADLDGDGDLDLLLGSELDRVHFAINEGGRASPRFGPHVELPLPGDALRDAYRLKLAVTDWNGDGAADLLIGGCVAEKTADGGYGRVRGHVWIALARKRGGAAK